METAGERRDRINKAILKGMAKNEVGDLLYGASVLLLSPPEDTTYSGDTFSDEEWNHVGGFSGATAGTFKITSKGGYLTKGTITVEVSSNFESIKSEFGDISGKTVSSGTT